MGNDISGFSRCRGFDSSRPPFNGFDTDNKTIRRNDSTMRKNKPSERQKQFDYEYAERKRWVKLMLLEELPADCSVKWVLYALDRCIRDKKDCWLSHRKLALRIGKSEGTAARYVKFCEAEGWIKVDRFQGYCNHYRINWNKVFDESTTPIQDKIIAAQAKVDSGEDAEDALDSAQEQQRVSEKPRQKQKSHKRNYGSPGIVSCSDAGYSPHGPPTDKPKYTKGKRPEARPTGNRWDCHIDPYMLHDAIEIDKLFDRAVSLGFSKNTDRGRMIVWSIAVHCRKAETPGALFRHKIESGDLNVSLTEEDTALKEIAEFKEQSNEFNSIVEEVFEGAT